MKVLISTDLFQPAISGVATFSHNLAEGLAQRGHTVIVVAPSTRRHSHTEAGAGYTIHRLWSVPLRLYPLRVALRPADEIRIILEAFQPDVVHVQSPLEIGRNTIMEARKLGIPVVSTNHAMPENVVENVKVLLPIKYPIDRIMRLYGSYLSNRSDFVTMPTQSAIDTLSYRTRSENAVVSNGVDVERFKPGPTSVALKTHYHLPDEPIVTFVGRIDGEKHLEVFVRALAIARATRPVHGLLVGKGTVRTQLEELANQLGMSSHLTFTGFVSDEDLPGLYRLSTLFAISSPAELQSIVTLEAVASGLPIVAADAAALPELCQPGVNGELFETDDPMAMAEAILSVLKSMPHLRKLSRASREIALRHSFEATLDRFEQIYAQQVARRTAEPAPVLAKKP
jgi:1,2-diacylglycerol 3-alpha-glucosyltransferase